MSQKDLFPETLIGQTQSSVQDTHVSRSQLQVNEKVQKTLDTSGPTYIKLLHAKDPLGVFLKMFLVTLRWDSTKFSLTWKMKNTLARRSIYQLTRLVLPTKENASGSSASLWATPTTQEFEHPNMNLNNQGRRVSKDGKNSHSLNLADSVKMWPTPTTNGYGQEGQYNNLYNKMITGIITQEDFEAMTSYKIQQMWPTPDANMGERGTQPNWTKTRPSGHHAQYTINQAVRDKTKEWEKGSLNPDWVEWLMGYDRGWTDLDCDNPQSHDGFIREPKDIPRVARGKKDRAKRLKGLGNAVLPQIPMQIALAIKKTREVELCKNVKKKDVKTKQT